MSVAWLSDFDVALQRARAEKKLLLVYFALPGRPLCAAMERETFARQDVVTFVAGEFVPLKLDPALRPDLFERLIGGYGALATLVADRETDPVGLWPGYATPTALLGFLHDVLSAYPRLLDSRRKIVRQPNNKVARLALAEAYDALGSDRRAEKNYRELIAPGQTPHPDTARMQTIAHERLARSAILGGRNLEAREHLESYWVLDRADRFGRKLRARVTEGLVLAVERQLGIARVVFDDLRPSVADSRDREHLLLALGMVEHELNDDVLALATLQELVRDHPRSRLLTAANDQIDHIKNPQAAHQH